MLKDISIIEMKNIVTRSLSGVVYIALIVSALWCGLSATMALAAVFGVLAVYELKKIMTGKPSGVIDRLVMALDMLAVVLLVLCVKVPELLFGAILIYPLLRFILALYDKDDSAFASAAASMMSLTYIGLPMLALAMLYRISSEPFFFVLSMFVLIWLNDTGAYCVGSTIGRHPLFPRLSPKKSWEGFWGGLLFCISASVGAYYINDCGMSLEAWLGMGVLVCVLSTLGDLFESLLKRNHHIKDSGRIIPGHGGILDRIDSLLFVSVGTLAYLFLIE